MGRRGPVTVGLAASLVGLVATGVLVLPATPPAIAAADDPPEPILVVPGADTDGRIRVRPASQVAEPGGALAWLLANGGSTSTDLEVGLHEVVARDGRVTVGDEHEELTLLDDTVTLAPGEIARVRLPVPRDATSGTVALVATDSTTDVEVTALAVVGSSARVQPHVRRDGASETLTVRLDASAPALVDVAVRATAWPGLVGDEHVFTDVLVPAGGRDVPLALPAPLVGRLTVDVAVSGAEPTRTSVSVWWWPRELVAGIAVLLVVVTAALAWRVRRHLRRR